MRLQHGFNEKTYKNIALCQLLTHPKNLVLDSNLEFVLDIILHGLNFVETLNNILSKFVFTTHVLIFIQLDLEGVGLKIKPP